jgi:hypothetical protein
MAVTLLTNERVSSDAEAEKVAKKRLRQKKKDEHTASLTLGPGDTHLVGGVNVNVSGWGGHDGKYAVTKAKHSVNSSGGYGTEIELRKCLEGY